MPEQITKVEQQVEYMCDVCGEPVHYICYRTKNGKETYKHICVKCRNEIYLEKIYPYWVTGEWKR